MNLQIVASFLSSLALDLVPVLFCSKSPIIRISLGLLDIVMGGAHDTFPAYASLSRNATSCMYNNGSTMYIKAGLVQGLQLRFFGVGPKVYVCLQGPECFCLVQRPLQADCFKDSGNLELEGTPGSASFCSSTRCSSLRRRLK